MKIVQFLASKGFGGLENNFIRLCLELSKNTNVEIIVLKNSVSAKKLEEKSNVHILRNNPSRYNPLLYIELYFLLKKIQPDIVHTHSVKASKIFFIVNKFLNYLHVATKHNPRKGKVFNILPHVIAVSQGVRESIHNENVTIIYNGVTPIEVQPKQPNRVFTMLAVGRLDKIKGYDRLIKACEKLSFDFSLEIVGEGEEREALEVLIASCGLEEKVKLLGFKNDIPQRMKNADVVVMSSYSEGFSVVMVESLFYANLFLSTRVSGATEILEEKFLFDEFQISNKLNDIYFNYFKFQKVYRNLQEKIKNKFLLINIISKHIDMYQKLLKDKL